MGFLPSNIGLSCKFSLEPIQWNTCKNIMLKMQNIGTMLQHVRKHRKKNIRKKNTITKMRSSANKQTCLHKRLNWPCASGTKGKAIHNWNSCYSTLLPIPVPVFAGIARFLSDSRFYPFGFRFNSDILMIPPCADSIFFELCSVAALPMFTYPRYSRTSYQ